MKPLSLLGCMAGIVLAAAVAEAEPVTTSLGARHHSPALRPTPRPGRLAGSGGLEHGGADLVPPSADDSPLDGFPSFDSDPHFAMDAAAPCFGEPCCPPRPMRFAFGEYLYWRPTNDLMDYAILDDGGGAAISGDTAELEYEAESGIRAGFGCQMPSGWDLRFAYTGLESSDHQVASGVIFATLSHPAFNVLATDAEAVADLDYDLLDLELGHSILVSEFCRLRLHGGFRGARIDQALEARYNGGDFDRGLVARSDCFSGFGLRAGAEGTWLICCGFGIFGRASGSLLAGTMESSAFEEDNVGVIVDVEGSVDVVAPATELAMGLSWEGRHWHLQCGYEVTSWHNLSRRMEFHDDVHVASFSRSQGVLGLHGLFTRVAYRW